MNTIKKTLKTAMSQNVVKVNYTNKTETHIKTAKQKTKNNETQKTDDENIVFDLNSNIYKTEGIVSSAIRRISDLLSPKNKYDFHATFDDMLGYVLGSEGGFADNPNDKGGRTNYGITQTTYDDWNKRHNLPQKDVKNITKEEVRDIYYYDFYLASGADKYEKQGNDAYAYALFDVAVNHGIGNAEKFDKQAKGDVDKLMDIRKNFYIAIVANNPSQKEFEEGWQNRWNAVYARIDKNHEYENYIA